MEIKFADNAGLIVIGTLLLCSALFPEFAQVIARLVRRKTSIQWSTKTRIGVGIFGGALVLVGVLLSFRETSVGTPVVVIPNNIATPTPVPAATPGVMQAPTLASPLNSPMPTPAAGGSSRYSDYLIVQPSCNCVVVWHPSEPVLLRLRWGATTSALAERGADFISYTVTLDGEPIEGVKNYRQPAVFVANPIHPDDPRDAWWVYWDYPIGGLPYGEHMIEANLVTSSAVDTGWTVVPVGTTKIFRVSLLPVAACPCPPCC